MTKTMRITLTEDFLVPTDDGNIIFEPGDEIEVEYEDEDVLASDDVYADTDEFDDSEVVDIPGVAAEVPAEADVPPAEEADPLSFAANQDLDPADDEEEVYIEDPVASDYI